MQDIMLISDALVAKGLKTAQCAAGQKAACNYAYQDGAPERAESRESSRWVCGSAQVWQKGWCAVTMFQEFHFGRLKVLGPPLGAVTSTNRWDYKALLL